MSSLVHIGKICHGDCFILVCVAFPLLVVVVVGELFDVFFILHVTE